MKKKELLLIGSIVAVAALLWIGMTIFKKDGEAIRITVDGETYGTWELSKDQTIEIGKTNVCEIKNGVVRMIEADCPDQLCIKQAPVGENGGMIVCLPNKVIIEGANASGSTSPSGVDAVG